jgi:hypothetical protein
VAGFVSGLVLVTAPNLLQQTGCPGFHDAQGQPIIEQYKKDDATAYVEHDPVTGEAQMLRTSTGMQSLYVYDGTGNPTAHLTSGAYTAFAYDYDPYGVREITANSGGLGTSQNPYTFKAGIQDRVTGWVKFGARWYDPPWDAGPSTTPSTRHTRGQLDHQALFEVFQIEMAAGGTPQKGS